MTRVHIWGASGYAAAELVRILNTHPFVEIITLESRSHAGQTMAEHFPRLRRSQYVFDAHGTTLERVRPGDIVFAAGAQGEAHEFVPQFLAAGARVIDLSADYRFDDTATYGLSEWNRNSIAQSSLVANPGCYPTATLLAILPLREIGPMLALIVDAKSGITGAGRIPNVTSLFAEVAGDIRAYGLDGHRHQPEIERVLLQNHIIAPLTFTPHVVPLAQGMLVDCYGLYADCVDAAAVAAAFHGAYADEPFLSILNHRMAPSVKAVLGTNHAELRIDVRTNVVRVLCAIDNLGKGAAGQAVQNFNIMLGYPEETALNAHFARI